MDAFVGGPLGDVPKVVGFFFRPPAHTSASGRATNPSTHVLWTSFLVEAAVLHGAHLRLAGRGAHAGFGHMWPHISPLPSPHSRPFKPYARSLARARIHTYTHRMSGVQAAVEVTGTSGKPVATPAADPQAVAKRLQSELMALMASADEGVSAFPDGDSLMAWRGTVAGPQGSVYEGLTYKLALSFPTDYPFRAPTVRFETACFHPNVDQVRVCLWVTRAKRTWFLFNKPSPTPPFPHTPPPPVRQHLPGHPQRQVVRRLLGAHDSAVDPCPPGRPQQRLPPQPGCCEAVGRPGCVQGDPAAKVE